MNDGPYITGGNPGHPGVKGEAYNTGPIGGFTKVDSPGTGTFPPHLQGTVSRAQPAGLSSSAQYGEMTPGSNQGQSPVGAPDHFPLPNEMVGNGVGLSMVKQQQPMIHGVNIATDAVFNEKGEMQESDSQKRETAFDVQGKGEGEKKEERPLIEQVREGTNLTSSSEYEDVSSSSNDVQENKEDEEDNG